MEIYLGIFTFIPESKISICELFHGVTDSESIVHSRVTRESEAMVHEFFPAGKNSGHFEARNLN